MKANQIFNDEKGVTLIEVLLVAVTGGFLLTSLSVASGLFLTSYSATMDDQDLTLAHHIAMERVLRTVTAAEEIELPNSTTLTAVMPDGGTEQFTWSGTGGDPMYLYRDDLDGVAYVDGVTNLSFAAEDDEARTEGTQVDGKRRGGPRPPRLAEFRDMPGPGKDNAHRGPRILVRAVRPAAPAAWG